ncbi:hypothetical protein [uncultured Tissierella sp.]|uniref:hypothetical protein n=1 Tax=uncultured Tissierella sp. TaxID=448160 RepID=UPI00280621D3|nr:hypothetical protein [uncultured Tissierella sp.]MDU5082840.1 hypothetical protein [Bacillota bacterium]
MTRRSTKARKQASVKLNWNNKTLEKVARYFLYSEGRLSKDQIIEIGNQTLFHKLKSGGYIEEVKNTDKGVFKTTEKLRNQYKVNVDSNARFSGSGSTEHSKGVYNIVKLLPQNIIMQGKIQTEEDLKDEFKKLKKKKEFKTNVTSYREKLNSDKINLIAKYKKELQGTPKSRQALLKAHYTKEIEKIDYRLKVLGDTKRGISHSDFRVIATREEAEELLINLQLERDKFEDSYYIARFDRAIDKLQNIISGAEPTQEIQINFEIITKNYEARDIIAKENYEVVTGEEMIFLPAY